MSWEPQDIADDILGRQRPPFWGTRYVLESPAELDALECLDIGDADRLQPVWQRLYDGRVQGVLWPMRVGRVRQGNASNDDGLWALSHRGDH